MTKTDIQIIREMFTFTTGGIAIRFSIPYQRALRITRKMESLGLIMSDAEFNKRFHQRDVKGDVEEEGGN